MFKMSAYPLGMSWPDPKKYDLLLNVAEQKNLKHTLTGSLSADRSYVPNLYAENIPAEGLNLRTSVVRFFICVRVRKENKSTFAVPSRRAHRE